MDSSQSLGLRSVVLGGASRCTRRSPLDITDNDFEIDKELGIITFNIFHVWDQQGFEILK